ASVFLPTKLPHQPASVCKLCRRWPNNFPDKFTGPTDTAQLPPLPFLQKNKLPKNNQLAPARLIPHKQRKGELIIPATQILVVEDERLVATALQNELGKFGYGVAGIASSADEAVEKALAAKPDLILMDINLQGRADGIQAAQKIHERCQ